MPFKSVMAVSCVIKLKVLDFKANCVKFLKLDLCLQRYNVAKHPASDLWWYSDITENECIKRGTPSKAII